MKKLNTENTSTAMSPHRKYESMATQASSILKTEEDS